MENLIGKEKYFVHKGTWENHYEWRIQKVTITGLRIDKDNIAYAEFSFASGAYDYPVTWLKDTFREAKEFAIKQINEEKRRQIAQIKKAKE